MLFDISIKQIDSACQAVIDPRDLADPAIWSPAFLVNCVTGNGSNRGLAAQDDGFTDA